MKAEEKFNQLVDKYKKLFLANNGYTPFNIRFEKGWVLLTTNESLGASKHRVTQFERMTNTLETRLNKTQ